MQPELRHGLPSHWRGGRPVLSVTLHADEAGCLRRLVVSGHAPDVACAAITALTRTAATLLAAQPALQCRGAAPRPGVLELQVGAVPVPQQDWVCGISTMVEHGVRAVAAEYPRGVVVECLGWNGEAQDEESVSGTQEGWGKFPQRA